MNSQRVASRMVVGAVTAIFALLALTAMHALPMAAASDTAAPATNASTGMPDGHTSAMSAADAAGAHATGAHNTGGVPSDGHTLLHLCFAVLAAALLLLLAGGLRQRPWTQLPHLRVSQLRACRARDIEPPSLARLCLLRC